MQKYTKKTTTKTSVPIDQRNQNGLERLNHCACEIDALCRQRLPDGRIQGGVLQGKEAEIRQDALIMVVRGFLEGNPRYKEAVAANDTLAQSLEMQRSTSIALHRCKLRLIRRLTKKAPRHVKITEYNCGSCQHPANQALNELPQLLRIQMIMDGLNAAAESRKLSPANVSVAAIMINDGLSVAETAKKIGVTRAAINQQLNRVRKVMPRIMELIESPHDAM